jgi:hypothetical protein
MSGTRFLALALGTCALLTSALIAIPLDGAETPDELLNVPPRELSIRPPVRSAAEPDDATHAALPRLWLGNPAR